MEHLFVFLTGQETNLLGVVKNFVTIVDETSVDDFEVSVQEFVVEEPARTKIDQIESLLLNIIQEICRVRICLHNFPFE